MHLAIDLDGVVFDFTSAMNKWAKKHHGEKEVEPTNWDWFKKWKTPAHFSAIMAKEEFWRSLEPYPGAIDGVATLYKMGHNITFVTHRPLVAEAATDYLLGYWELWHSLILTSSDKGLIARKINAEWAVDDLPSTVANYRREKVKAYLFDRPWNQEADHPRVFDWDDVIRRVEEDSNGQHKD